MKAIGDAYEYKPLNGNEVDLAVERLERLERPEIYRMNDYGKE